MTTGSEAPSADDFARRRLERHDQSRRRFAVVAVVLVVVGAVAAALLVVYALGGEPERDADGRLVPPEGLALDADAARDLVADGTWPGEDRVEGMPAGDADRIRWLLSDVAWDGDEATAIGSGLRVATEGDADLVEAMVSGVAGAARPLLPALRDDVMLALRPHAVAVAAALAGEEPPPGEPAFADGGLLATFAAVGHDDAGPLEEAFVDGLARGWTTAYPIDRRDAPGGAQRFRNGYREQFRRTVQPVVLLYVGLAGRVCDDGVDDACRAEVTAWTEQADTEFAGVVLDTIPRDLLPDVVGRALGADRAAHRTLPPAAQDDWERFRATQGYGVTGPVLDALAG